MVLSPRYSAYSVLNVINPAISWQDSHKNPLVQAYKVQLFKVEDNRTMDLGTTTDTYMEIPSDDYRLSSSYQLRIATIGQDGRQSSYEVSDTLVASPLRFDFLLPRSQHFQTVEP